MRERRVHKREHLRPRGDTVLKTLSVGAIAGVLLLASCGSDDTETADTVAPTAAPTTAPSTDATTAPSTDAAAAPTTDATASTSGSQPATTGAAGGDGDAATCAAGNTIE